MSQWTKLYETWERNIIVCFRFKTNCCNSKRRDSDTNATPVESRVKIVDFLTRCKIQESDQSNVFEFLKFNLERIM